jgi:hypothetical protein
VLGIAVRVSYIPPRILPRRIPYQASALLLRIALDHQTAAVSLGHGLKATDIVRSAAQFHE